MKLNSFLLPVLAGIATADLESTPQHAAEAYMLRHTKQTTTTSSAPSIPHSLAEAILLQRLGSSSVLGQIPESLDEDEAVSYINEFGKAPRPLFDSSLDASEPKQLVIAFSGVRPNQYKQLKAAIPRVPLAFTAPGLGQLVAKPSSRCAFGPSINPTDSKCWSGRTQYLQYDATKVNTV
jgi:hypothetical protein